MSYRTPGPWSIDPDRAADNLVISGADGTVVAEVIDAPALKHIHGLANARLVAKAPELLAIVRALDSDAILRVHNRLPRVNVDDLLDYIVYGATK